MVFDPRYDFDAPGILTKKQRRYLLGESDIESGSQHERTIRSRIRERAGNILQDIEILSTGLEDRDIDQIPAHITNDNSTSWDPYSRLGTIIGFLLRIHEGLEMYYERDNIDAEKFEQRMELVMSGAIQYALQTEGYHAGVSCEIDIDAKSVDELGSDIGSLSEEELFSLYMSNQISREEYIEELHSRGE